MALKKENLPKGILSDIQYKHFSILIEDMWVGKKLERTLSVKLMNQKTGKYDMFQNVLPTRSALAKEVVAILEECKQVQDKENAKAK